MELELRFFCDPSNHLEVCRTAKVRVNQNEPFGLMVTRLNRGYMPCHLWPVVGVPKIVALWCPEYGPLQTMQNLSLCGQTKIVYAYIQ